MAEFLKLDNRVVIKLKIVPVSPLLIIDGREMEKISNQGKDAKKNRNLFLRDSDKQIYIPGSTLKGLFRERFYQIYGDNEKINKIFGCEEKGSVKGTRAKMFLQDAHPVDGTREDLVKVRNITPVDHFTMGVKVPLEFEYCDQPFTSEIVINNATVEELQGIYFTLRDSMNGEIRIGSSKTRGFGEIRLEIDELIFEKYRGKKGVVDDRFFERDEKLSQKLGNNYLKEALFLKPEYKKVDMENPNEFITTLFSEVK